MSYIIVPTVQVLQCKYFYGALKNTALPVLFVANCIICPFDCIRRRHTLEWQWIVIGRWPRMKMWTIYPSSWSNTGRDFCVVCKHQSRDSHFCWLKKVGSPWIFLPGQKKSLCALTQFVCEQIITQKKWHNRCACNTCVCNLTLFSILQMHFNPCFHTFSVMELFPVN